MERVLLDDIAVEYAVTGHGAQVALLHALPFVSWYAPLVTLLPDYSVLTYRRRVPLDGRPFSLDADAAVCSRLLQHVSFDRPHVVGHSYGAILALALAHSGAVPLRSIAVLEPATIGLLPPEQALAAVAPMLEVYRTQGPAVAARQFLTAVLGGSSQALLDRYVPGAYAEVVKHAEHFFQIELPAVARWNFEPDDAPRVNPPMLNMLGTQSGPRFAKSAETIASWFPDSKRSEIAGAGHLLMAQQPVQVATSLVRFWTSCRAVVTPPS